MLHTSQLIFLFTNNITHIILNIDYQKSILIFWFAWFSSVKFWHDFVKDTSNTRKRNNFDILHDYTHIQWWRKCLQAGKCINTDILWSVVYVWVYMLTNSPHKRRRQFQKMLKRKANFCRKEVKNKRFFSIENKILGKIESFIFIF